MHRICILFLVLCTGCCLVAANAPAQATAAKQVQQAYSYRLKKQYDKAIAAMYAALKADPRDVSLCATLGSWLYEQHRFREAADVLAQGSRIAKNGARAFAKPLARSLVRSNAPQEALNVLNAAPPLKKDPEWDALRAQAAFVARELTRQPADTAENLGPRINSADPEYFPFLSADTQTLYLTRRIGNVDEDFFKATPDSCGGWLTARNMGTPPNSLQQEAAQMISADRHYLFFMRCDNRSENGWAAGGCDLYMAYTADSIWSAGESFGATINTPGYEGMPCLSADNRQLFFVSNRPGGYGGLDLWAARFERGLWQQPYNLGPEVNTPGDESAPFLHPDNKTLYFTSDGHPGFGGKDLFRCRRGTDTAWTGVENLGYPLNSAFEEVSLFISPDGQNVLFSSDRQGPAGNFDIYKAKLPAALQPEAVTYIKGVVYDSISRQRLNYAHLSVLDPVSLQTLYEYQSNRGDGSFMMVLQPGVSYLLQTDRVGYKQRVDTLIFPEQTVVEATSWDLPLLSSDYRKPLKDTTVMVIGYAKNVTSVSDSVRQQLMGVLQPYLGDPEVTVIINSYTDNSGTPLLNDQISDLRARILAKEVTAAGFGIMQVLAQGWAESNPLVENDTEENRNINRRTEIVIRK